MVEQVVNPKSHLFTQDWFSHNIPVWTDLLPALPSNKKFLEIGSFEGRSACWLLENALSPDGELYCIDTWEGSPEFNTMPPSVIAHSFDRFRHNVKLSKSAGQRVRMFQNKSIIAINSLYTSHLGTFDLIYIDADHFASSVLSDACAAWPLLKSGGILIFDDYLWNLDHDLLSRPKLAIDAFTTVFGNKLQTLYCGGQYIIRKLEAA